MDLRKAIFTAASEPARFAIGEGRGIVIVGGGRYLPSAYILIRHLREHGCTLPIQLWHLGPSEIIDAWFTLAGALDVETIDATPWLQLAGFLRFGGWEAKIAAIIGCRFQQVLLIDADNIPLFDPSFVFESEQFLHFGQVFWPDFPYDAGSSFAIRPAAWKMLGMAPLIGAELESGQLVVDKAKCWREIQVAVVMNANSERFYRRFTWGDKDTYVLAWRLTKRPYYTVPLRPAYIDRTSALILWQHWHDGRRMFQHQRKWFEAPDETTGQMMDDELLKEESLAYHRDYWGVMGGWPMWPAAPSGPVCFARLDDAPPIAKRRASRRLRAMDLKTRTPPQVRVHSGKDNASQQQSSSGADRGSAARR